MTVGIYLNKRYFSDGETYISRIKKALGGKIACKTVEDETGLSGVDVLFVLGGDGTILSIASACAQSGVKIIGINYGHLGFLAEFEPEKLDEAAELVRDGSYVTQKRSMLEISYSGKKFLALNDLVIQRSTYGTYFSNTVNLHAEIDGATVDNFSADGIIVSTPTGSTAYSLAAGGSVLTPDLNAFILTPVCAHSLHSRPVVFSDGSTLLIKPVNASVPLVLNVDGKVVCEMNGYETVTVKKSRQFVEFITKNDKNFFNKLLIKLNIWSK